MDKESGDNDSSLLHVKSLIDELIDRVVNDTSNALNNNDKDSESANLQQKATSPTTTTTTTTSEYREPDSSQLLAAYEQEINRLKEVVSAREADNAALEARLGEHVEQSRQTIEQLHANFAVKMEQTLGKFQNMHKEKTSSFVMKYADAEKRCVELTRNVALVQSRLGDSERERARLVDKLAKCAADQAKTNAELDARRREIMQLKHESGRMREHMRVLEAREKAAELKVRHEQESHTATRSLVSQLRSDIDALNVKLAMFGAISTTNDDDEDNTTNTTATATTITTTHDQCSENVSNETNVQVMADAQTSNEQQGQVEESTTAELAPPVGASVPRVTSSSSLSTSPAQKQMNKELMNEVLKLREIHETFMREKGEKEDLKKRIEALNVELVELRTELQHNQAKQSELLQFTANLTAMNSQVQSANSMLNERLEASERLARNSEQRLVELEEILKRQKDELNQQLQEYKRAGEEVRDALATSERRVEELSIQLADEQDENFSLKKKTAANIKDLTRQLNLLQKKLDSASNKGNNGHSPLSAATPHSPSAVRATASLDTFCSTPTSYPANTSTTSNNLHSSAASSTSQQQQQQHQWSRASSVVSLGGIDESGANVGGESTSADQTVSSIGTRRHSTAAAGATNGQGDGEVYIADVDKQKMIEKIIKLQKMLAKRNEKIDFFHEHVNQLTLDLQRKTKIIQSYAMSEEVGAFTSEAQDAIKREMSNKSGIMSMLYGTNKSYMQTTQLINASQSNMTMELSLEINRKLQALLEDTLIKNITLKESLETLGQEIARLSQENRQIRLNE